MIRPGVVLLTIVLASVVSGCTAPASSAGLGIGVQGERSLGAPLPVGEPVTFVLEDGTVASWSIDGEAVGRGTTHETTFDRPGSYRIHVSALGGEAVHWFRVEERVRDDGTAVATLVAPWSSPGDTYEERFAVGEGATGIDLCVHVRDLSMRERRWVDLLDPYGKDRYGGASPYPSDHHMVRGEVWKGEWTLRIWKEGLSDSRMEAGYQVHYYAGPDPPNLTAPPPIQWEYEGPECPAPGPT